MSTPKEFLSSFLHPLAEFEKSIKKPFADAGFPDIPMPIEFHLSLVQSILEISPLRHMELELPAGVKAPPKEALMMKRVVTRTTGPRKIRYR